MIFAATRRERAHWTPEVAECKAAHLGVKLAKRYGLKLVILQSDYNQIISRLTKASIFSTDLDSILEDVLLDSKFFEHSSWSHVRRDGNYTAHQLVGEPLSSRNCSTSVFRCFFI